MKTFLPFLFPCLFLLLIQDALATTYAFREQRCAIFDVESQSYVVLPEDVFPVAFSPDGKWFVTCETTNSHGFLLTLWDAETHVSLPISDGQLSGYRKTVLFSPDSRFIAVSATCAFHGDPLTVFSVETGQRVDRITKTSNDISEIYPLFLPSHSDMILSERLSEGKHRVKRVDPSTNHIRWEMDGKATGLSVDGSTLLVCDAKKLRVSCVLTDSGHVIWEKTGNDAKFDSEEKNVVLTSGQETVERVSWRIFSRDKTIQKHTVTIAETASGRIVRQTEFPEEIFETIADGKYVLAGNEKAANLYEVETGKVIRKIKGAYIPNGTTSLRHARFSSFSKEGNKIIFEAHRAVMVSQTVFY